MRLIDTHCHFDDISFDADRNKIVQSMNKLGVSDLIFPAITAATWGRLKHITDQSSSFHATYGLHPVYMAEHTEADLSTLRNYLERERPVAVGECGLDFFLPELDREAQIELFRQQVRLAREYDLPLVVHARRSLDVVLKHIRQVGSLRGVIHSFAGSQQQADQVIEQGFYLGVGGTVTYERAQRLRRVITQTPLEYIMLETDAPDQPDSAWSGKRNVPTRLPHIAGVVATLTGYPIEHIAATTTANARCLFGIA